jgi:hypothetical protein
MANFTDELTLEFSNYEQLTYEDNEQQTIKLFLDDEFVGNVKVYIDEENSKREYICVNFEIIYLDSLFQL